MFDVIPGGEHIHFKLRKKNDNKDVFIFTVLFDVIPAGEHIHLKLCKKGDNKNLYICCCCYMVVSIFRNLELLGMIFICL